MSSLAEAVADLDPRNGVLIGGKWRAGNGEEFTVDDPATGEAVATIAGGTPEDGIEAVVAADGALPAWRRLPPRQRSEILRRAYELIIGDIDRLAGLIALENGKSESDARGEVTYAAEFFRWFAEESVRTSGEYGVAPAGGVRTVVTHKPIGVAAMVTPWNFPAAMATRKIAPALAAGCTVVLKPASETPLTALAIARLLAEAGVPDGVVNLVPTASAGPLVSGWLADERVRLLSFTGSTTVGRLLLRQAADRVVNSSMELGGNAPFIIADDADLDAAVDGLMVAKFRGGGQACTAANRIYVHSAVADDLVAKLAGRIRSLKVGPSSGGADIGPLISAKAAIEVSAKVDEAVAAGAKVVARADLPDGLTGHFVAPVLLTDVPEDSTLVCDEIFGPVASVVTWESDAEVVAKANSTEYGLSGYVYSGDLQRAIGLAEALDIGMIGVNRGLVSDPSAPFGGMKQSGLGREGARMGLEEFQETQYLSVDWPDTQL